MSNPILRLTCICGFEIPTLDASPHQQGYFCPRCKGRAQIVETTPGSVVDFGSIDVTTTGQITSQQRAKNEQRNLISAEIEAMDWPDVIGE